MNATLPSRSRRAQAAIDSGAALLLTMLAYPFPIARATLPVPVYVGSVLVLWQLVQVGYCALTAGVWGRTAGMYLMGLELVGSDGRTPTRRERAAWGALAGLAAVVHALAPPRDGTPTRSERASGTRLVQQP